MRFHWVTAVASAVAGGAADAPKTPSAPTNAPTATAMSQTERLRDIFSVNEARSTTVSLRIRFPASVGAGLLLATRESARSRQEGACLGGDVLRLTPLSMRLYRVRIRCAKGRGDEGPIVSSTEQAAQRCAGGEQGIL